MTALAVALIPLLADLARPITGDWLATRPELAAWLTVFLAICLQALPFLVLGVAAAAAIATFVSAEWVRRVLPRNDAVSYTHLDVYKRQVMGSSGVVSCSSTTQPSYAPSRSALTMAGRSTIPLPSAGKM